MITLVSRIFAVAGVRTPSATSNASVLLGLNRRSRVRPWTSARLYPRTPKNTLLSTAARGFTNTTSNGRGKSRIGASSKLATSRPRMRPTARLTKRSVGMVRTCCISLCRSRWKKNPAKSPKPALNPLRTNLSRSMLIVCSSSRSGNSSTPSQPVAAPEIRNSTRMSRSTMGSDRVCSLRMQAACTILWCLARADVRTFAD
ncbi:MAG: Uncharacterised protein [Prochlorococcus marinus str. MIT 9313]|nr:MAG: Uncharacterised protein [Prochlorococcus marinus str. MIT 9313]